MYQEVQNNFLFGMRDLTRLDPRSVLDTQRHRPIFWFHWGQTHPTFEMWAVSELRKAVLESLSVCALIDATVRIAKIVDRRNWERRSEMIFDGALFKNIFFGRMNFPHLTTEGKAFECIWEWRKNKSLILGNWNPGGAQRNRIIQKR